MKLLLLLPIAALATAFVVLDEQVLSSLSLEKNEPRKSFLDEILSKEDPLADVFQEIDDSFTRVMKCSKNAFDDAVDYTLDAATKFDHKVEEAFDGESWMDSIDEELDLFDKHGPHHGRPRHPPKHRKPHHPHHGKPNETVYQLIAGSKYTTKLAKLINQFDDLVQLLNGTAANYTVFAPTDKAFEKIRKHHPKPSKEFLKELLTYHVSSDFYPAGRVLVSRTIPTLKKEETLGGVQRLSTQIGLRGLTVNFYSRIVAIDIFGTNGVIHGIDSILVPPPKAIDIISFLPSEFSTLELAITKTGLYKALNDTSSHVGGTLFAPSNFAFKRLGPRINAFLFSPYGQKYLKALLRYHVVANHTLYSDAYYSPDSAAQTIPKGVFHVDLPTLLDDKYLSIDVARFGRLITIKINAFSRVVVQDGIAKDGVIQVVGNVLIPPKKVGGELVEYAGEELTEEDLMERLAPMVEDEMKEL